MAGELIVKGTADLLQVRSHPEAYPRIKDIPAAEAEARMRRIVYSVAMYRGAQMDDRQAGFIAASLLRELLSDNEGLHTQNLTFEEIAWACRRAALGEDMYGVNVASLYRVIVGYARNEGHELQREVNRRRQVQSPLPVPELQALTQSLAKSIKR